MKPGDVMTVLFSATMAISSFGTMAPNITIIQEACIAASDYFTLVDRQPQMMKHNLHLNLIEMKLKEE